VRRNLFESMRQRFVASAVRIALRKSINVVLLLK